MNRSHPRHRPRETLVQDMLMALGMPLSHGTKYDMLDDALWKWSELAGKYEGCRYWTPAARKRAEELRKAAFPKRAEELRKAAFPKRPKLSEELRHEHVIPRSILIGDLLKHPPASAEALAAWLDDRCLAVVVTMEEDGLLNKAGLRSKMPGDWDGVDVWARYRAAGIVWVDTSVPCGAGATAAGAGRP